jgi:hypothetical protein
LISSLYKFDPHFPPTSDSLVPSSTYSTLAFRCILACRGICMLYLQVCCYIPGRPP